LKAASGAAGTWVVTAELLDQVLLAVDDPGSPFDLRFGWEASPAFARPLESALRLAAKMTLGW
jgi:hypothetical protein